MQKNTLKKFSKRFAQYGALTAVMAGAADANGQIIYTDEVPDFAGGIGGQYFLDVNNDGTDDFRIYHNGSLNLYVAPLTADNGVLGSGGATFAYPFALSSGATVSGGAGTFFNNGFAGGFQSLNYGSCSFGNWCNVTDRYLGLEFDFGGSTYYGWARLDVSFNGNSWVVKDYAYESSPGVAIAAGAVSSGPSAPIINCPGDVMANSNPGVCGAAVSYGIPPAIDPGGGSVTVVQTSPDPMVLGSGDVFPVGTTMVTFTATNDDAPNEMTTCSFMITVVDNEAPTMSCPADITQTNDMGACGAMVTVPAPTIMDNCPVVPNNPAPLVVGPQTDLIFDAAGMINTPTTLTGTQASVGGDVTMTAAYNGDFGAGVELFALEGPDGSAIFSSNAQTGGDCAGYQNVFTVAEATWNSWVTNFGPDLTFILLADPDVDSGVCVANFVQLSAEQGMVSGATLTNDFNNTNDASGFYPVGTTTVTFTYTDGGGNSVDCTVDVTVTDDEAPEIVCIGEPSAASGSTTATVGLPIPDNNPGGPLVSTLTVTDDFVITDLNVNLDIIHSWIGDLTVTITAPDGTTSAVIVDRPGVPTSTVGCNNTVNDILVDMDDEATDAIEEPCLTEYNGSFSPNNPLSVFDGISTVGDWTLSISDSAPLDTGSLEAWTLNYEYESVGGSSFDVVLDANGNATVNVADLLMSSSDNCGNTTATTISDTGMTQTSLTTTFAGGSGIQGPMFDVSATNEVVVNTFDVNLDDATTLDIEIYAKQGTHVGFEQDAAAWTLLGMAPGTVSAGDGLPTPINLAIDYTIPAGETHAFYIIASNLAAGMGFNYTPGTAVGNSLASDANIEIFEGSAVIYPFGTSFSPRNFNGNINYTTGGGLIPVTSFDVDCSNVGESLIEVTVTDDAGNASTCTATINVIDNTAPVLVCQNFTLELGEDGTAMLDPFDVIDMNATVEACGIDNAAVDIDDFDCSDIGTPVVVTVFVSDPSGNLASCMATVTVVDALAPVVTCPADQTVDPGAGAQLFEVPDYFATGEATATDNCTDPLTVFSQDPAPGTFLGDGTYTVTMTATDESGNIGSCTFELTVESILGADDNTLGNGVVMFPNPAQGQVTISNSTDILLERATIYDANGRLVNTTDLTGMQGQQSIDISNLASGVYMVQIQGQDASVVKRLVKE